MLARAVQEAARWQKELPRPDNPVFVSVNVSSRQLFRPDLINEVRHILARAVLPKGSLRLEITELLAMENPEKATGVLRQLADAGAGLSLDDFGTGYSSLSYLNQFTFDTIKLDRSFIAAGGQGGTGSIILRSMVALAHELGKSVVAEGVETEEDVGFLRSIGCEYGQGFYYSEPMGERDVLQLLRVARKAERRMKRSLLRKRTKTQPKPEAEVPPVAVQAPENQVPPPAPKRPAGKPARAAKPAAPAMRARPAVPPQAAVPPPPPSPIGNGVDATADERPNGVSPTPTPPPLPQANVNPVAKLGALPPTPLRPGTTPPAPVATAAPTPPPSGPPPVPPVASPAAAAAPSAPPLVPSASGLTPSVASPPPLPGQAAPPPVPPAIPAAASQAKPSAPATPSPPQAQAPLNGPLPSSMGGAGAPGVRTSEASATQPSGRPAPDFSHLPPKIAASLAKLAGHRTMPPPPPDLEPPTDRKARR